jgi:HlyD family secretion protein
MLWGIFLAIIVIGFIIVRSSTRDLVGVRVAVVDHQNILSTVSTNGKVEPIEEFPAYALAPGVVEKVYVDVGQKVKPGELLVKMDDADAIAKIAAANAAVHSAEATLHDVDQGGSQDERIGFSGDLSRAQQQHSKPFRKKELPLPAKLTPPSSGCSRQKAP